MGFRRSCSESIGAHAPQPPCAANGRPRRKTGAAKENALPLPTGCLHRDVALRHFAYTLAGDHLYRLLLQRITHARTRSVAGGSRACDRGRGHGVHAAGCASCPRGALHRHRQTTRTRSTRCRPSRTPNSRRRTRQRRGVYDRYSKLGLGRQRTLALFLAEAFVVDRVIGPHDAPLARGGRFRSRTGAGTRRFTT